MAIRKNVDGARIEPRVHAIAVLLLAGFAVISLINLKPWLLLPGLIAAGLLELVGWLRR